MAFNPALAGIGVLGTSAAVGGGLAVNGVLSEDTSIEEFIKASQNPELKIKSAEWDDWHILSEDRGYSTEGYSNKYIGKYKRYFVGITVKEVKKNNNDTWWKWSYRENYKSNASFGFSRKEITDFSKLRDSCKKAYKGDLDTSTGIITFESNTKFKEEDVWAFCSPAKRKPTTVIDGEYPSGTIGAGSGKSSLVSTKDNNNDIFWSLKREIFFYKDQPTAQEAFFKKLKDSNQSWDPKALKKKCEEAYNKPVLTSSSAADSPTETEVKKYCSLEESSS